ncbi:MAG TPA: chitobiase/beta-hexosaminidase C-terminal domain-containing protein [Verrucomicrobiae bacterium]|nr:chitobiase/beta-hexosaminidase C-terminal domain-containing protein [Verrucomicrobiae bacterium]
MKACSIVVLLATFIASTRADVAVLTQHNNLSHTGANLEETLLKTNNVNTNTFGLVFTRAVDDQIYAQPLIMTNVDVPGKGSHNLVIVATVNDSVYAFDADDASVTAPYWQVSFTNANAVPPRNSDLSALGACGGGYVDFSGNMGIVSTPTIDPVAGTIYLVARTKENGTTFVQRLHALDVRTGQERANSPMVITATYSGNGDGNVGGVITFDPARQNQRAGLSLINGVVYITWASHCDLGPYHGWVIGYDATNLTRVVVYNDTPNGGNGGIWMSGEGISADTNGNLFLSVGNGSVGYNGNPRDTINRGESFLKLTRNGGTLNVASWFTPYNYQYLENGDIDLGSAGLMLIPGTSLAFSGGKQGVGYLVNRDNMGGLSSSGADTNIIQSITLTANQIHGGMVWWDGPTNSFGYIWPAAVFLQQYKFDRTTNKFILPAFAQSPSSAPGGQPGGILAVTANGTNAGTGIVWASHQLTGDANHNVLPGILHAYDAQNVSRELWNSEQISARDSVGSFAKFVAPTVANGKVYLATFSGRLDVYGLAAGWVAVPTFSPNGGTFTNSVAVTLTDATAGAAIYYTLDGSTPTTNSILYTAPFTLTNNAAVKAKAFKAGFVDSGVAVATFLNSSSVGTGTGLKGSYYSNQVKTFNNPATLVRTDATVNFNWGTGAPDPSISVDSFTVRWTGAVQPPLGDTYTFYTTTDDGVRLWINDQLIIDDWVDQAPTERSGSITLIGQQRYNIRMEYYENGGGAAATLSWSTPSMSKVIIPQIQMYPVTNPPPTVTLSSPANGSVYTASASVTLRATASSQYDTLSKVDFYANTTFLGSVSNSAGGMTNTFTLTATGINAGSYPLKAVATDLTGLASTSAPVSITVSSATGAPYGLPSRPAASAFLNMPAGINGSLPPLLSQTGVFTNTPAMNPAGSLLPYSVNVPLWSDGAVKTRYFVVPNGGAPYTPEEQVTFTTNAEWTFPAGTVFVKTFELVTNETNPNLKRRLETRLLVRGTNGAVYGVTYKWRTDNSEADLLSGSLSEDIAITTSGGTRTQTWYYPSPSDCLVCHTPAANYVLGVNTRQLNVNFTYPSTGQTDNQLRTLNRIGLFNPAFNESAIATYPRLSALTNLAMSSEERARSYLDANCAQCHRPGGSGITFDGRYDTALTNQNIINAIVSKGDLGYDNARVVVPKDVWRSVLYGRMNSTDPAIKMPALARNLVDTNAVSVMGDWINSLDGTPALAPPGINPNGGSFAGSVGVALQHPDLAAEIRYTLDGLLPNASSPLYSGPISLTNNLTVRAKAFEAGYIDSVAANATFFINPSQFTSVSLTNGVVHLFFAGVSGQTYVLQATTNLVDWVPVATNIAPSAIFEMTDPQAAQFQFRFYRTLEQ